MWRQKAPATVGGRYGSEVTVIGEPYSSLPGQHRKKERGRQVAAAGTRSCSNGEHGEGFGWEYVGVCGD